MKNTPFITRIPTAERLETLELRYLAEQYHGFLPGDWAKYRNLGPAGMIATGHYDILGLNRVIGLGTAGQAVDEAMIEDIKAYYRELKVPRFFIQTAPVEGIAHIQKLLENQGGMHYNDWVKLVRPLELPIEGRDCELELCPFGTDRASEYALLMERGFDWPEGAGRLFANAVGRSGYRHYFAMYRGTPVAAAALYVDGELVSMAGAATLPEYRGRGAQNLLLKVRLEEALRAGCRWAVTETARELPGKPAPSFRNMLRNGFEVAYYRPNYLFADF